MVRKFFSITRKFNGQEYKLQYQANTKAEAKEYVAKYAKGRKARIVPASMIGGRRVYLIYTRF